MGHLFFKLLDFKLQDSQQHLVLKKSAFFTRNKLIEKWLTSFCKKTPCK